jgi:putative endonuclease
VKYLSSRRNFNIVIAEHLRMGRLGERLACRFLIRSGFDILARRYRAGPGELDIVAFEGETLVFIEVKSRATRGFGDPAEFVDWEKQQALRRVAEDFIARHDLGQFAYRFDVVSVLAPGTRDQEITLYRGAF